MKGICINAMLQASNAGSLYCMNITFNQAVMQDIGDQKFIAHCDEADGSRVNFSPHQLSSYLLYPGGDFSQKEIDMPLQQHFIPRIIR